MRRRKNNNGDFSIVPFLPATGVEKEGARKGNVQQRRMLLYKDYHDDKRRQNTAWKDITW